MDIKSLHAFIHGGLIDFLKLLLEQLMGGENRIVAYNPYQRLIYIFSIFNVPTNVPADLLDAIGLLWTRLTVFGKK